MVLKYYIVLIQFYPRAQKSLNMDYRKSWEDNLPLPPFELLEEFVVKNPIYYKESGDTKKTHLKFGNFTFNEKNWLLSSKLGKEEDSKDQKMDEKGDFFEEPCTRYPHVSVIWDRSEQAILIQKNTSVFPKIQTLIDSLKSYFDTLLTEYDIITILSLKNSHEKFWDIISDCSKIYKIEFTLNMPNFLGKTNQSIKEVLDDVQELYHSTSCKLSIMNEEGNIVASPEDMAIKNMENWVSAGGGKWEIEAERISTGSKGSVTSEEFPEILEYSDNEEFEEPKRIKIIIEKSRVIHGSNDQ